MSTLPERNISFPVLRKSQLSSVISRYESVSEIFHEQTRIFCCLAFRRHFCLTMITVFPFRVEHPFLMMHKVSDNKSNFAFVINLVFSEGRSIVFLQRLHIVRST